MTTQEAVDYLIQEHGACLVTGRNKIHPACYLVTMSVKSLEKYARCPLEDIPLILAKEDLSYYDRSNPSPENPLLVIQDLPVNHFAWWHYIVMPLLIHRMELQIP